jgi:hypothetical protein
MKHQMMTINITFAGKGYNINVIINEDNVKDVMSKDGVEYLTKNAESIEQDFISHSLLRCLNSVFKDTMEMLNNAKTTDN